MHRYPLTRALRAIAADGLDIDASPATMLHDAIAADVYRWAQTQPDVGLVMVDGVPEYCEDQCLADCDVIADHALNVLWS